MTAFKDTINLLPRVGESRLTWNAWVLALLLFALAWAALFSVQLGRRWILQSRLETVSGELRSVQQSLSVLQHGLGIAGTNGASPEKATLIRSLLGERVLWSKVFNQFSQLVPRGMWFDSLDGTASGRAEIRIRGGAFSYTTVSEFMHAMQESGFFEKPDLRYAQKAVAQGREIVSFEIVCGIKKTAEVR